MTEYTVEITKAAEAAIDAQAHYIAVERQQPLNAAKWLQSTFDAIQTLKTFPQRCSLAEENEDVEYEVRQLSVGSPVLLFTIDEALHTVWVSGDGQNRPRRVT